MYSLGLENVGEARAYFEARGEDAQAVYDALREYRAEINSELSDATVEWHDGQRWIALKTKASLDDTEEKHEETREWMVSNLLKLRDVIQPRLDQIMAELQPTEIDDAAPLQNDTGAILMKLTELIAAATWREAVTYRETWAPRVRVAAEGRRAGADAGGVPADARRGRRSTGISSGGRLFTCLSVITNTGLWRMPTPSRASWTTRMTTGR